MRPAAVLAAALLAAIGWFSVAASASQTATLSLQSGQNAVTWNGAEPYPIADFADTPVTHVHRWDAVGQEWLSHFVGQADPTLPELHLLPRAQYLLFAEADYELDVLNPLAGIDPHADLRMAEPPDDPLRFEAYWPNEDSPLEDLIVLRPDDERLSVKAEVAGGVGEVEVYWVLDGRLNHQGMASNDVELLPGKHDDARLSAVDATGQAVVVKLPRVVKLLPLELPEMTHGMFAFMGALHRFTDAEVKVSIEEIANAGFNLLVHPIWQWGAAGQRSPGAPYAVNLQRLGYTTDLALANGLSVLLLAANEPAWATRADLRIHDYWDVGLATDLHLLQDTLRLFSARHPKIKYWWVSHESNLNHFFVTLDPHTDVERIRMSALGVWYENPSAAIIANGLVPVDYPQGTYVDCPDWHDEPDCAADAEEYLQALYDYGFRRWTDIVAYHPNSSFQAVVQQTALVREVMVRNGDGDAPLWATSVLIPSADRGHQGLSDQQRANEMARAIQWLDEHPHVSGQIIFNFRETLFDRPLFWGLVERDFVNGQPVPTPTWTAVVEFLQRQREQSAANE